MSPKRLDGLIEKLLEVEASPTLFELKPEELPPKKEGPREIESDELAQAILDACDSITA